MLTRALTRSWWAILWERLWPALAAALTSVGLFLAVSWTGLWLVLPPLWRAIGVFVLLAVCAWFTVPLLLFRLPRRYDSLRRLDRASGLPHRPATAIADELASNPKDPFSAALWHAHLARATETARMLRAGKPHPRVALRDRFAVRALVLLVLIATFFAAGGERVTRVTAAFDWTGAVAPANYRVDAWINPPIYTSRPPVILPGLRPGEPAPTASAPMSVPTGSLLVIRSTGTKLDVAATGGLTDAPADKTAQVPPQSEEKRLTIADSGTVTVRAAGETLSFKFNAIPDNPPKIELTKPPQGLARGALQLDYKLEDDYGVVSAEATFELKDPPKDEAALDADPDAKAQAKPPRPLYGSPNFALILPQARTRAGVGMTSKDLTESPWAGADVKMTLVAKDEAGNVGRSKTVELQLPQRLFAKPLAKALIEQRRTLALDANARERVATALDALALAPELFTPEFGIYLGLRSIYWKTMHARTDDDLRDVVERLWKMAVAIEDGEMADVIAALRNAEDTLRKALERNAPDEEIKKLTDQLRAALDRFMQALAEQLRKNPQLAQPLNPNARTLSQQDLKNMLDRLENLARLGSRDAARQLLEQLQSMLENLQMARPGQPGPSDDMQALNELGDMIRKEQQLRDRTYREGQDQRQQPGDKKLDHLQRDQKALREQLQKLLEAMRKRGPAGKDDKPGGQNDPLGQAEQAMRDAERELGKNNPDGAVDAEARAIESLRRGARNLAQQMRPGPGMQPGQPGGPPRARADQNTDPLGRPLRGREYSDDSSVKVPGEIDVQRARRIIEELRRRYADPKRPRMELDYIERLLKDF